MCPRIFCFILVLLSLGSFNMVQAESQGDMRRVVTSRSVMTRSLGGGQSGELSLNTKVEVLEEKGAWSRISTEGWVRTNTLSAPSAKKSAAPAPVAKPKVMQGALRVTEFLRSRRDDVSPPREYVVLTVKNDSPRTVNSWSGLLVAVDKAQNSVFREKVSETNLNWKPGESRDVSFFWQPGEEGYDSLGSVNSEKHTMLLLSVEIE